jgi:hypothetical protein
LAIACLAMTTAAFATTITARYNVFMKGVGPNGFPGDAGGQFAKFTALVNTTNGFFTGSARRQVVNRSGEKQSYNNVVYFVDRDDFKVSFSLYSVTAAGIATYTASGFVTND